MAITPKITDLDEVHLKAGLGSRRTGEHVASLLKGLDTGRTYDVVKADTEVTIASGVAAATQAYHTIDTESDASTDDLDSVTGDLAVDGSSLFIRPAHADRSIVLAHAIGTNKIACPGGHDLTLSDVTDWAWLKHNGTQWTVLAWSSLVGQEGDILVQETTIATAAVKTLNATPVVIIPAPSADEFVAFVDATLFLDFASAAYDGIAAGEDLLVSYTDASGQAVGVVECTGFMDQGADTIRYLPGPSIAAVDGSTANDLTPVAQAAIVISMLVGEIATGDSPLKVRARYRRLKAAW